jgi:hypothetical protein
VTNGAAEPIEAELLLSGRGRETRIAYMIKKGSTAERLTREYAFDKA